MITKSYSEEDLKTGSANSMKGKKRVKGGWKMFLLRDVKNMFSASCHLASINVTGVWYAVCLCCSGKMLASVEPAQIIFLFLGYRLNIWLIDNGWRTNSPQNKLENKNISLLGLNLMWKKIHLRSEDTNIIQNDVTACCNKNDCILETLL